jgi:hypothetical protein
MRFKEVNELTRAFDDLVMSLYQFVFIRTIWIVEMRIEYGDLFYSDVKFTSTSKSKALKWLKDQYYVDYTNKGWYWWVLYEQPVNIAYKEWYNSGCIDYFWWDGTPSDYFQPVQESHKNLKPIIPFKQRKKRNVV